MRVQRTIQSPEHDVRKQGANTSRLVSTTRDYDAISGMARVIAIPVWVRPSTAPSNS